MVGMKREDRNKGENGNGINKGNGSNTRTKKSMIGGAYGGPSELNENEYNNKLTIEQINQLLNSNSPKKREEGVKAISRNIRVLKTAVDEFYDNVNILIKTAKDSPHKYSRLAATRELYGNVEALKNVIINTGYEDSRLSAIKGLYGNAEILKDIVMNPIYWDKSSTAINNFFKSINELYNDSKEIKNGKKIRDTINKFREDVEFFMNTNNRVFIDRNEKEKLITNLRKDIDILGNKHRITNIIENIHREINAFEGSIMNAKGLKEKKVAANELANMVDELEDEYAFIIIIKFSTNKYAKDIAHEKLNET